MKKLFIFLIISAPVLLWADDFQSSEYVASFTRSASIDSADSVFYNPAGTIMMGKGLFIKTDNNTIFDKRSIEYNGESDYKNYENNKSIILLYNFDKLSIFASYNDLNLFSNTDYKDGVPYFSIIQNDVFINEAASNINVNETTDRVELEKSKFKVSSKGYELRSGFAYKIIDSLSVSLGGKYLFNNLKYSGNGFYRFFSPSGVPGIDENIHSETYSVNYESDLKAYGYFFGLYGKVLDYANIGFLYEGYRDLKYSGETLTSDLPVTTINSKMDKLPTKYSLGIRSERFYSVELAVNSTYKYIDSSNNSKDYCFSIGYIISNGSTFDVGYKKTILKSESNSYLNYESDSDSFGAGIKTNISENAKLSVSFSLIKYKDISMNQYEDKVETFKRESRVISCGIEFNFFNVKEEVKK